MAQRLTLQQIITDLGPDGEWDEATEEFQRQGEYECQKN